MKIFYILDFIIYMYIISGHVSLICQSIQILLLREKIQNHIASERYKFRSVTAWFSLTSSPAREHGEHAETDLLRPRVHRPPRLPRRFAKVQVETDVGRPDLDEWCRSTPGRTARPLSMGTRDRAYSWSAAGSWPRVRSRPIKARLSLLAGANERAQSRTTAISFSLPGCAPHGSPFSPVVEPDSLCALHNLFCNSTLRAALTGTPARHPHSEMGCAHSRCSSWRAANWMRPALFPSYLPEFFKFTTLEIFLERDEGEKQHIENY